MIQGQFRDLQEQIWLRLTLAHHIQIISSLQGDSYLLPSMMSISVIFYPFLNPVSSPGTNPNIAAIGNPDVATADGCAANCVAVLLSA